jgi:hypothetical protein
MNPRDAAVSFLALLTIFAAPAIGSEFYGPLRARDLSPFGFLRLDMRPAHAVSMEPGGWALETEFASQNTWAMSPGVGSYLTGLESGGRHTLGDADMAAIRDLPGENYLVDLDMTMVDVTLHHEFSQRLSGYLITSAVFYEGGFLDGAIESFHDAFGQRTFCRPAVTRNDSNVIYDLKSTSFAQFGTPPTSGGLLDPTIGLRYSGIPLGRAWQLSFEGAVKLPVGGERRMLSTGRTDYGLQASAQRRGVRQAFYANASAVYFSGGDFLVRQEPQIVPTLVLGYEFALTANTNLNFQGYMSTSVYSHRETDLEELLANKYQISAGIRHRHDNVVFSFGFTENLQSVNNSPDFAFQLGLTWLP